MTESSQEYVKVKVEHKKRSCEDDAVSDVSCTKNQNDAEISGEFSAKRSRVRVAVACIPCKEGKRRCDGGVPCGRCVKMGRGEVCLRLEPKKRGRRPKTDYEEHMSEEQAIVVKQEQSVVASSSDITTISVHASQALLLSALLSHGLAAVVERPLDVAASFGLDLGRDFVGISIPSLSSLQSNGWRNNAEEARRVLTPIFLQSRVVSARFETPALHTPGPIVGKRICELATNYRSEWHQQASSCNQVLELMECKPGKPTIRAYECPHPHTLCIDSSKKLRCYVRVVFFFNEHAAPVFMFSTILRAHEILDAAPFDDEDEEVCQQPKSLTSSSEQLTLFENAFGDIPTLFDQANVVEDSLFEYL